MFQCQCVSWSNCIRLSWFESMHFCGDKCNYLKIALKMCQRSIEWCFYDLKFFQFRNRIELENEVESSWIRFGIFPLNNWLEFDSQSCCFDVLIIELTYIFFFLYITTFSFTLFFDVWCVIDLTVYVCLPNI